MRLAFVFIVVSEYILSRKYLFKNFCIAPSKILRRGVKWKMEKDKIFRIWSLTMVRQVLILSQADVFFLNPD